MKADGYVDNSQTAATCPHIHSLYDDYGDSSPATGEIS